MAYRADIEIAVKGAQELKRLQNEIRSASDAVNTLNSNLSGIANLVPRSFDNLNQTVTQAARSFNAAALGTKEATDAAREYVQATNALNSGLRERAALLAKVQAEQRRIVPGDAGTGQQTPALPPQFIKTYEIGRNWTKFFLDAAEVAVDLRARSLNTKASWNDFFATAAQAAVSVKANSLNTKASWNTFFIEAAQLADDLTARTRQLEAENSAAARKRLATDAELRKERAAFLAGAPVSPFPIGPNPRSSRRGFEGDTSVERAESALRAEELHTQRELNAKFFAEEKAQVLEIDRLRATSAQKQTARIQNLGKAVRGSLSSAAIGGAFPLLFGQSPQAAVGGAIGGLLGGQAGGFAGSLVGTALGEIEAAKAKTKELSLELGFSSAQAQALAAAFELAGRNGQQLEAAVTNIQGLSLSTDETASAIKIAVELSKEYGGSVEKVAQAFADTLESGKVSISTLNKFTAQGIPVQETLSTKIGVSRTKLLEMAKDGKISVQQLTDTLVQLGKNAETTADKAKTGFDRFTDAVFNVATAISSAAGAILKNLVPALDEVLTRLANIITRATTALNLIADTQVGEASGALFRSGLSRGMFGGFAQSKGVVDNLTKGLKTLNPQLATNREQLDKIAAVAQRYRTELQQFGGQVGEYATKTAQVELSRVQRDIITRGKVLGASQPATRIGDITVPANLPPSTGKGGATGKDELQRSFERGNDLFRQFSRQAALLGNITEEERKRLQIQYDFQDRAREIGELKNKEQKTNLTQLNDEIRRLQLLELQTDEIKKQLELFYERAGFSGQPKMLPSGAGAFRTDINLDPNAKQTKIDEMRQKLDELVKTENQVYLGAQAIGEAFGTAFKGIASGAMTAQEALAGMMSSIADHFLDMAAQIITQQMTMIIYGTIMKALGLTGGLGGGFGVDFSGAFGAGAGPIPGVGGAFGGGMKLFADGGFVTGPTSAIVGEGGEPEYIIPASKMRSAMSRYATGARGSAVIPAGDDTNAGGGTATMAPTAIDVRYSVERINSVDYVTADQFRAGMAQAAQQGATQGEQRTLRRLQQSRATRSRLGMN